MQHISLPATDPCDEFLGTPSQELRLATWRAREESMRGGQSSPIGRTREVFSMCREDLPRALARDALPPAVDDLAIACRKNKDLFDAALLLGQRIESAALAAWNALRTPSYFPDEPGATRGEQASLTEADLADFCRFADYAGRVAIRLLDDAGQSYGQAFFDASRIPVEAAFRVAYSAVEAALFTFLRQRLPGMFYHGEWDAETSSDQIRIGLERKNKLLAQIVQTVEQRKEQLKRVLDTDVAVRSSGVRLFPLSFLCDLWNAIHISISNFNGLQLLTEMHNLPKQTRRLPVVSAWPYPLLNTRIVQVGKLEHYPGMVSLHASSVDRYFSLNDVTVDRSWERRSERRGSKIQTIRAVLVQPQSGGSSSLSRNSYIPLKRFTHPEDPLILRAEAMARRSDQHLALLADVFGDLELPPESLLALEGIPRVQLVVRESTRKRWWGLLGSVPSVVMYLLMTRKDAHDLGLRDARPLPAAERRHLAYADAPVIDDARVIWWESGDYDDDEGGDDDAPPPPSSPNQQTARPREPELVTVSCD